MTSSNVLVSGLMSEIPGIISCGIVDLENGKWRRLVHGRSDPEEFLDFVALSVKEIFDGDMVKTIKTVIEEHSPDGPRRRELEEVILRSTNFLHVFLRLQHEPDSILCVVTPRDAKLGMVLSLIHAALAQEVSAP